jgi:hypothetical protein
MLTIQDEASNLWIGILPIIRQPKQEITLNVFQITPQKDDLPIAKIDNELTRTVNLEQKTDLRKADVTLAAITVKDISTWRFPTVRLVDPHGMAPEDLQALYGGAGRSICAVTCGDLTISANSVEAECGVCAGIR